MKKSTVSKQAAERDYSINRKSEKVAPRQKKFSKAQSNSHVCGDFQTVFDILLPIEVLKPISSNNENDVKQINQLPEKLVEEKETKDQDAKGADAGTGDAGTLLESRLSDGNHTQQLSDEEVEESKNFELGVEVLAHPKIHTLNKSNSNKRITSPNISKGNKRVSFDMKKMKLTQQTKNKNNINEEKSKPKDDRKKMKLALNKAAIDKDIETTEISRHDWLLEAEEKQEMFENLGISTASVIKAQYEENENGEDTVLMAGDTVKPLESIPESVAEEVSGTDARDFGAESGSSEDSEDDVDLPSEVQEMEKKIYELTAAIEKARSKIRMFHKKRELNDGSEAEIQELKSYIKNSLSELELYSSRIKELLNINKQKPITEFINEEQKPYIPYENKISNKQENYIQKPNTIEEISIKIETPENNVEENGSIVNENNKSKSIIHGEKKYENTIGQNEQYENSNNIVEVENNSKGVNEDSLKTVSLNNEEGNLEGSLWTMNDSSVPGMKSTPIESSQTINQFNQTEKMSESDCCIDCISYNSALESRKGAVGMSGWQLQERFISSNKEVRMESSTWIACDKFETFDQSDEEHIINQTFPLQDTIPKVIICGSRDDVPRIILCDQIKPFKSEEKLVPELVMSLTSRLCNSYSLQEKLAVENAELEGGRYHLQQELLQKDGTVEALQNKVNSLQTELKFVSKENSVLNDKLAMLTQSEHNCPCSCWDKQIASSIEKEEAVDAKLYQYSIQMEEQLVKMWNDLRIVQLEMEQVLREKEQLEYQKHLLNQIHENPQDQLKVVRQQFTKLQEDFNKKDEELRALASEVEGLKELEENDKKVTCDCENSYNSLLDKLDNLETETLKIDVYKEESIIVSKKLTSNNHTCDKYRYEIEEIRSQIEESAEQIEYYRKKRFDAQQRVDEQRHQIEEILCETNGIQEQINMQLQIVKGQYEDKIHDLAALPEKLKATQIKLQEAQQTRCFAESNCQELVKELQNLKEEALKNAREMNVLNSNLQQCAEAEKELYKKITDSEKKNNELKKEISGLNKRVQHLDETNNFNEKHLQEKLKETYQLSKKIEATSEEYAHQHLRMKDRSEMNRLTLQSQISELENELVESRSSAKTAQKERDEMRMKMQIKLDSLGKNYDEAQIRIRCLTTQIQCLQKTCTIMEPIRSDYLSTDDLASSTYVTAALCEAAK